MGMSVPSEQLGIPVIVSYTAGSAPAWFSNYIDHLHEKHGGPRTQVIRMYSGENLWPGIPGLLDQERKVTGKLPFTWFLSKNRITRTIVFPDDASYTVFILRWL